MIILTIAVSLSGCLRIPSEPAICEGSLDARKAHAGALVADGGPQSQRTGQTVLAMIKAGCNE